MAIAPNSDVIICKGVPLDNSYEHTIYQSSLSSQYTLFYSYAKYIKNSQTYQRVNRNMIRIDVPADKLYDCNYMMFRNTAYLNTDGTAKWFYAFITEVNYINDNASEIVYEIDVMQTYYFNYSLGSCFVEREHTLTDGINENFEPEEAITGDYVTLQYQDLFYKWSESSIANTTMGIFVFYIPNETLIGATINSFGHVVITTTPKPAGTEGGGYWGNGFFMPGTYTSVPLYGTATGTTADNLDALIAAIVENGGKIYQIAVNPYNTHPLYNYSYTMNELNYFGDSSGAANYYPKNKKLFHYPFKKVLIVNSNGQQKEYKYELFSGTSGAGFKRATFNISVSRFPQAEAYIRPTSYSSITYANGLTFNGFPTFSWSEDSFANWWAQNGTSAIMGAVGSAITSIAAMIAGGPVGIAAGVGLATQGALGLPRQIISAMDTPDTVNGSASSNITNVRLDRLGFTVYEMSIRPEIARTVDDYFSKYGYSINKLKQPNIRSVAVGSLRPQWNYIKTTSCMCKGTSVDAASQRKIEQIYNAGITFWMAAANVGNYTLDNSARG